MKIGDKVEIINFFNHYFANTGVVVSIDLEKDEIEVDFDNGVKKICKNEELKIVEDCYKIGDNVKITNFFNHHFSQYGKIVSVNLEKDEIEVDFGNGIKKICKNEELKVIKNN